MEKSVVTPIYSQIALDIALRISKGELKENTKIYGRSVMASEYGVSPETIRRAIKLLEDMDIVETKQNSGSLVVSAENAGEYVRRFAERNDIRTYQQKLGDLLSQQAALCREISEAAAAIVRVNEKFSKASHLSIMKRRFPPIRRFWDAPLESWLFGREQPQPL